MAQIASNGQKIFQFFCRIHNLTHAYKKRQGKLLVQHQRGTSNCPPIKDEYDDDVISNIELTTDDAKFIDFAWWEY